MYLCIIFNVVLDKVTMKEYSKKSTNVSRTLDSTSRTFPTVPVSKILQAYKNRVAGKQVLRAVGHEKKEVRKIESVDSCANEVLQGYFEKKSWEEVDFNQAIEDAIAGHGGYENFNNNLNLGDDADGITFGMELEVVHSTQNGVEDSITAAREVGLTTATALDNGSSEKWRPTWDGSLAPDDSDLVNTPEEPSAVEWVSPVFGMDTAAWDSIHDMCTVIKNNDGTVNDSCSEHIHVGHQRLAHEPDKFNALFEMYTEFQDVIDIIARSGSGTHSLRPMADTNYAKPMEEEAPDTELKNSVLYRSSIITKEKLQKTDELLALISPVEKESLWDVRDELYIAGKQLLNEYLFQYNSSIGQYGAYIEAIRSENIRFPALQQADIRNTSKSDFIDSLRILCRIADLHVIFKSYVNKYNINPIPYENRYQALNVTQNFQADSKPTVEIRRFNPTIQDNVIQANVLLSTLLMLTAAKDTELVAGYITKARRESIDKRAAIFIELISNNEEHISILSNAYAANK